MSDSALGVGLKDNFQKTFKQLKLDINLIFGIINYCISYWYIMIIFFAKRRIPLAVEVPTFQKNQNGFGRVFS